MFFNCVLSFPAYEYILDVINILQVFTQTDTNVVHMKNGIFFCRTVACTSCKMDFRHNTNQTSLLLNRSDYIKATLFAAPIFCNL